MSIRATIAYLIQCVLSIFIPVRKQVIFESFHGKQYSDNPRAISEKMHELYPEYKIVWALKTLAGEKNKSIPSYVKIVRKGTIMYYASLVSSCALVTNEALRPSIRKRSKQFFVQTWHGDRIFKKILYEAWENGKRPSPVMDEYLTDLCIAGSNKGVMMYREAFHYKGRILNMGCPRNDILINNNEAVKKKIKNYLNIQDETNVLLYAPTYRDGLDQKQNATVDLERTMNLLESDGTDWVCLVRAHSNSKGIIYRKSEKIIDVTEYHDMSDLLCITDFLITDYSSSSTDFVITKRPVVLAAFDKEEYIKSCREFKYDISEIGFMIANDQQQLEELIMHTSKEEYAASSEKVMSFYEVNESGCASEIVCNEIDKHCGK